MSYELSDKMILRGELMKYRRSLCEQVSEYGGLCKKCRASSNGQCAIGIVIKSLEHKSNSFNSIKRVKLKVNSR